MDCGGVLVKYILFIFNILFVVCGVLLIVFGSIMVASIGSVSNISESIEANSVPIAILALGCVIFIIAFLGCCGAIRENICCTMTYSVLMLILFMCQLALVAFVWMKRDQLLNSMDNLITKIWDQRRVDQEVMDTLQVTFNCCGKDAFTDYSLAGEEIPLSCCGFEAKSCSVGNAMTHPGCSRAVANFWEKNMDIIRYAGFGVAAVQLVAFIFACCLANQVRNNDRRSRY